MRDYGLLQATEVGRLDSWDGNAPADRIRQGQAANPTDRADLSAITTDRAKTPNGTTRMTIHCHPARTTSGSAATGAGAMALGECNH